MKKTKLYNHSKHIVEEATKSKCPRCKGFGALMQDKGELCVICDGRGEVWLSKSGWIRPLYGTIGSSEILY